MLFDSLIKEMVFIWGTQLGKTLLMMIMQSALIEFSPNGMLYVQPNKDSASNYIRERFNPMVRDNEFLFRKIRDKKEKTTKSDSVFHKSFDGGYIAISGANSPSQLASRPLPYLMLDEIDDFPLSAGKKGNPTKIAERRTSNFDNRKIIKTSSPGIKGLSLIYPAFEATNQMYYYVPCPACDHMQILTWNQMRYPEKIAEKSYYECANPECKEHLTNDAKYYMLSGGDWKETAKGIFGKVGFHLNRMYSPWTEWGEMVEEKLAADKEAKRGNNEDAKVFITTGLAELFDENIAITNKDKLKDRIEIYCEPDTMLLPDGVCYITFGTDVQDDRLETIVRGWGIGKESWLLIKKVHIGNPALDYLYNEHNLWLQSLQFKHPLLTEGKHLLVSSGMIDTGGHHSDEVYDYVRESMANWRPGIPKIYAYKGSNTNKGAIVPGEPSYNNKGNIPLWLINTVAAKDTIYSRLQIDMPNPYKPTPGLMHFNQYASDEYFDQLVSQKKVLRPTMKYVDLPNTRQEAIDCEVMALGTLEIDKPNLSAIVDHLHRDQNENKKPATKKDNNYNPSTNWATGWRKES